MAETTPCCNGENLSAVTALEMKRTVSLAYSTHRPETLEFIRPLLTGRDWIVLEEPPHPRFREMLEGSLDIETFLMEQDFEYPEFSRRQYQQVRELFRNGTAVFQVEPFLEQLLEIHFRFAEGQTPADLDRDSLAYRVYLRERSATKALITYYRQVCSGDFGAILEAVNQFARADADRFRLRDQLRAEALIGLLRQGGNRVLVEAGPMHVLLERYLRQGLEREIKLEIVSIDQLALVRLGLSGSLFSPGDELTLHHLRGSGPEGGRAALLAARALIYAKIVTKEEQAGATGELPHTLDEYQAIKLVEGLDLVCCRELFGRIGGLSTREAREVVTTYRPPA